MSVQVTPGSLDTGRGADSWFDWYRRGGHYDARLARDYDSYTERASGYRIDGPNNAFYGLQKEAGCVWDNVNQQFVDADPNGTGCVQGPSHTTGCVVTMNTVRPDVPNFSTRVWIRFGDHSIDEYSGGDPYSYNS